MKPRINLIAIVDSMSHANTIVSYIQNALSGIAVFEIHSLESIKNDNNENEIYLDGRFNSSVDRDNIKEWLKNQISNNPQVKNWVTRAKLSWHDCTHDDVEIKSCGETNYFEWSK